MAALNDLVAMADVRARVQRALFGVVEPVCVGRFVVLEPIARGAMGVVYDAYDPTLDRRVALKLLHPRRHGDELASQRLLAEAHALAKLDHPNVVPVHEVIEDGNRIAMVIERVSGQTLAAWEREPSRTWREIVDVYVQAGRGLEAAHALGVVHRDFKPANVIVGDDRRVRVLDFGLARFTADGAEATSGRAAAKPPVWDLTETGAFVGTLAYGAPEQLAGKPGSPASDQFSFCVALHRALEQTPPFDGKDAATLTDAINAGRIVHGNARRVPGWLRTVVGRGLAADPADRYPAMAVLLEELARDRGWRRWRFGMAGAALVVAAVAAVVAPRLRDPAPLAACDGGVDEIATVWSEPERARITNAVAAIGTPDARDILARVLDALDGYRDRWMTVHRDACSAHRRGAQSAVTLDRRMGCLRRRKADLGAAVQVLSTLDAASIKHALDIGVRMPTVDGCADLDVLEAELDLPASAADRERIAALRAELSLSAALLRAGRTQAALGVAERAATRARGLSYPLVEIEASLWQGRIPPIPTSASRWPVRPGSAFAIGSGRSTHRRSRPRRGAGASMPRRAARRRCRSRSRDAPERGRHSRAVRWCGCMATRSRHACARGTMRP